MSSNQVPVVAVVGRPNVGKSTLFNRLVGSRDAIIDDMPGVTRDRHYGEVAWNGRTFMLIDTGGYIPDASNVIDLAIKEQVEIAIREADLVLFVVDARANISAVEQSMADLLRRAGKNTLLAANKVDNLTFEQDAYANAQIYKLGLGEFFPVSALVSRNIGDFLDEIVKRIDAPGLDATPSAEAVLSLAVIGRPNVGKSSLVNAIVGKQQNIVTPIPGTTRDAVDTVITHRGREILIIDTAGLRKKARVRENVEFYSTLRTLKSVVRCDVAIVMIDAEDGLTSQDISVLEHARKYKKGLVIAVNKWDLIEKDSKTSLAYEKEIRIKLGATNYVPVVFISALSRQRIFKLIERAETVDQERRKTISTSALNKFLRETIALNPPPAVRGKFVKINYVTQVKSPPPVFSFFTNEPKLIPRNYRLYLENRFRETFGFSGVPLSFAFKSKN